MRAGLPLIATGSATSAAQTDRRGQARKIIDILRRSQVEVETHVGTVATPPAPASQLRGLTFATLEGGYVTSAEERRSMRWQAPVSIALMLLVIALWVIFR